MAKLEEAATTRAIYYGRTFVWLLHALASLSSTRQVMLRSLHTVCAGQEAGSY